jgi:16S rRNA (cytosine1402-N4)-methyltransferase
VDEDPFHTPVLCAEAIRQLLIDPGGTYVDGTVGGGGHAGELCRLLHPEGRCVCFDADDEALQRARVRLSAFSGQTLFVHANVRRLREELQARGISAIHGLLLDLGVSSHQIDDPGRGFSFRGDEQLDMRMDRRLGSTARDVVNTQTAEELAGILWRYGEERKARSLARAIVAQRPVDTTQQLVAIVERVVGNRFLPKSLARVFQALRIFVNDELGSLNEVLAQSLDVVRPGGRIVVISYHSLEDRMVKEFFRKEASERIPAPHRLLPDVPRLPRVRVVTSKPLVPDEEEIQRNPRARSAKMRVAERV